MEAPFNVELTERFKGESVAVGDLYFQSVWIEDEEDYYNNKDIQYRWYINGEKVESSQRVLEHFFEDEGTYTISVIVLKDGALAKASTVINVTTPIELDIDEEFSVVSDDYLFLIKGIDDGKEYVLELDTYNYPLRTFILQYPPLAMAREPNGGAWQPQRFYPMQHDNYTDVGIYYIGKLDRDILFNFYRTEENNNIAKITIREADSSEIPETIAFNENENNVFELTFILQNENQLIPRMVSKEVGTVSKVEVEYSSSDENFDNYLDYFSFTTTCSHTYNIGYSTYSREGSFIFDLGRNDILEALLIYIPSKADVPITEEIKITITLH